MVIYTYMFKYGQKFPISVLRVLDVNNEMQPDNLRYYIGPKNAFTIN